MLWLWKLSSLCQKHVHGAMTWQGSFINYTWGSKLIIKVWNAMHSEEYKLFIYRTPWHTLAYEKWKWNSLSCVRLFATPWTIVHGILQARILEWVAIPFSRGSSKPKDQTQVSCIAGRFFTSWATREWPKRNAQKGSTDLRERLVGRYFFWDNCRKSCIFPPPTPEK